MHVKIKLLIFAKRKDFCMEKLGLLEFESVLVDNISKVVINRNYISQNQDFWDAIVFKLFEEYYYSPEETSIRKQAKILEIFFNGLFEHRPAVEKPEDIINVPTKNL